ncbi:DUF4157 domain-containing protein [Streptomyces sp. RTd22]|uniref:eCIS core domain-containing protein n=1 Tax=Streptomyces sp. RTd22 TaxID=1841249 RepID=UPI001F4009CB|nr:DUF4157 domain-containing protein [Streptomyces sp. RTd22]
MLAQQSRAGNQAVVEMLRRSGHPGAQDRHQHGAGCGHQASESPVQRSSGAATVARAEEEDGHVHPGAHDTSPEGQSALVAAAMNSSSESLPSSVVAKAGAFYQNDSFSSTRVHRDAVAQRATAAMGAEAMTIGNHIFLSAGTADEKLIGHELSHVDKNLKGIPETGHSNGAGVSVTDPRQGSEQAAEQDGDAYAAGQTTAPSVTAQRAAANGSHGTVQRMAGRVALADEAPELSGEDHVKGLNEDSEEEVLLKRGVTPTQRMHMQQEIIRGSFVGLSKMLQEPDEHATRPDKDDVTGYVNQNVEREGTSSLIEFSTDGKIAEKFASESKFGYILTIKIKKKYLAKGATGAENGWITKQGAPYEIVHVEKKNTIEGNIIPLTEEELREAAKKEEMAEYLLEANKSLAAHMQKFQGADKLAEAKKMAEYKSKVFKD